MLALINKSLNCSRHRLQVGIFPKFSGEEFENFITLADKLRSDYDFAHTTNAHLLPRGESAVTTPTIRLLKPFDELVVDFQVLEQEKQLVSVRFFFGFVKDKRLSPI